MKEAIKIDFEKKMVALKEEQRDFRVAMWDYMKGLTSLEGMPPEDHTVVATKVVYTLKKVTHPDGKVLNYLVRLDEAGLFQDLAAISAGCFESEVNKRVREEEVKWAKDLVKAVKDTRFVERTGFYLLPWWKRLFYKPADYDETPEVS